MFYRSRKNDNVYKLEEKFVGLFSREKILNNVVDGSDSEKFLANQSLPNFFEEITGIEFKRVRILADVVGQLDTEYYKANAGNYIKLFSDGLETIELKEAVDFDRFKEWWNVDEIAPLNNAVKEKAQTCEVCAIGSLFMSMIDIENKINIEDVKNSKSGECGEVFTKHLDEYFPERETRLMEFAFEGSIIRDEDRDMFDDDVHNAVFKFRKLVFDKHEIKEDPHYETSAYRNSSYAANELLREIVANTIKFGKFSPEEGLAS